MIQKIDKPFNELKIGVLGFRSHLFDLQGATSLNSCYEIDNEYDFVFAAGYYEIIPDNILQKVKYGIFVFHETPVPLGRGSAPIYWSVKNKRKNITISCIKIDAKIDTGQIVYQHNIPITNDMGYAQLEAQRQIGTIKCFQVVLDEIKSGYLVLREQSGKGSYTKKRTPESSKLDASKPLEQLWDDIRVCDNDKFPAFFIVDDQTKVILKYEIVKGDFRHPQHKMGA